MLKQSNIIQFPSALRTVNPTPECLLNEAECNWVLPESHKGYFHNYYLIYWSVEYLYTHLRNSRDFIMRNGTVFKSVYTNTDYDKIVQDYNSRNSPGYQYALSFRSIRLAGTVHNFVLIKKTQNGIY